MHEDSLTECVECGAACERVLSAPAVHFKGSGFYTTDYARKGAKKAASSDGGSDSSDKGSSSEKSSSDKGSSESGSSDSGSSKSSESSKSSSSSD